MKTPKVSIVITCYNYGKYLDGCLLSAINQTYNNFEIIIINDGSTDNTDEVMAKFLNLAIIKYINQPNSGQAKATNAGINHASGELIAFLDADDLWDNTKLEQQVDLFANDSVGVVYSRMKLIDEAGLSINSETTGGYFKPRSGYILEHLLFENFIPYSSSVVRKECFNKFGLFNPEYINGLDWDMWLRISREYEFAYIDKPLLSYRVGHPGKLTSNIERSIRCTDLILKRFLEINPNVVPKITLNKALAYSYCSRGDLFLPIDRMRSIKYYLLAIRKNPKEIYIYIKLIKFVFLAFYKSLVSASKRFSVVIMSLTY